MRGMEPQNPKHVEYWFDVVCPWTWITSRWVAEVARVRGFEVAWRTFSLRVLNEADESDEYAEAHRDGHRIGRVIEAARAEHGDTVVGTLYTAIGERLHHQGRTDVDTIIREALGEAGLPEELVAHGHGGELADEPSDELDTLLRTNTDRAVSLAGPDVGIPIIAFDGVAFFGPVVSPAPTGEAALKLWDGVAAAASVPGFFEIKRGRNVDPIFTDSSAGE